jgi:C1A family cysteine protease
MASKMKRKGIFYLPSGKYKIAAYYRMPSNSSPEYVKQVIYQFGSIMVGSDWYNNWMNTFTTFPKPSGGIAGGHAYRIVGWHDDYGFHVVNSWGKADWGVNGQAYMGYDTFANILKESDVWKVVDSV